MPEFLEDPSVLTKEKLKSELVANNVTLPIGEQRKDVYVQLYLQHLTARNRPPLAAGANSKGPPDFSSDEEREPTPVLGSGAAVSGRSRAAVGRVRTPGRDHKGGRLAVVAPTPPPRARSQPFLLGAPSGLLGAGAVPARDREAGLWVCGRRIRLLRRGLAGSGRGGRWRGESRSWGRGLEVVCLEGVKLAFALLWLADSSVFLDRREWVFRRGLPCPIRKAF